MEKSIWFNIKVFCEKLQNLDVVQFLEKLLTNKLNDSYTKVEGEK
jgi:hypothetical protein